ncbi:unnamed protein product [Tetraodon nigroviridis]|uniref:(spotted green pufferfish) hypothetical protein n=1 Tax=Tetraodon nigroviridis TaxID=99883 RepID=Q4SYU7_TETNG|nr:unnamed protein product [Tetraodon nigroviridis]
MDIKNIDVLLVQETHSCQKNHSEESRPAFASIQQWWDYGKAQVKQLCQQLTRGVTKELVRNMKDLEQQVGDIVSSATPTENRGSLSTLKSKKAALANLLGISAQGALVRSRFMNISQMDAPSRFFFGLEKKNGQRKIIHSLRTGSGSEISDSSEIRKYAAGFYKSLYRSEWSSNPDMQDSFLRGLPQSVFKVWGMLLKKRQEQAVSAYWLQQEPVLWGTKLDIPNQMKETITRRMRTTGIANLGQVVALTGPRMDDPSGLTAQLGLTSYTRHQKDKCQLLNFVLGQAKMAVYLSRKRKMEEGFIVEPVVICVNMIKSRLLIDFNFQKAAGDLDSFIQVWGFNNVLCQVVLSRCRSPLLRHVVSHRRQVHMLLNHREELELRLRVRVDGFDYLLFVSSAAMKCFGCGEEGHIIRMCPLRADTDAAAEEPGRSGGTPGGSGEPGPPPAVAKPRAAPGGGWCRCFP